MNQYDEVCLNYFLKHQNQLFREDGFYAGGGRGVFGGLSGCCV